METSIKIFNFQPCLLGNRFSIYSLKKKGQALVEVLFAVGVIGVCMVALTVVMVGAIRNSRFSKNSALAAQYAQEGIEAARRARDQAASWSEFTSNFSGPKGLDAGLNWGDCNGPNVGIFSRCLDFNNSGDKSRVTATVSWNEAGRSHQVEAVTFLTNWSK